jgi:hypothetical protein
MPFTLGQIVILTKRIEAKLQLVTSITQKLGIVHLMPYSSYISMAEAGGVGLI